MLREVRKLRSKDKRNRIWNALTRGRITKHINEKGYVCYDSKEFDLYLKTAKKGRPLKILENKEKKNEII